MNATSALIADGLSAGEAARSVRDGRADTAPEPRPRRGRRPAGRLELAEALAGARRGARQRHPRPRGRRALAGRAARRRRARDDAGHRRSLGARGDRRSARSTSPATSCAGALLALARGWGGGDGPVAVLACPPGEQHDLGLIAFGLALRARGWRIAYLGQDTPIDTAAATAERLGARAHRPRGARPRGASPPRRRAARARGAGGPAPRRARARRRTLVEEVGTPPLPGRPGRGRAQRRRRPRRRGAMSPRPIEFPVEGLTDGVVTLRLMADTDLPAIVAAVQDPEIPRYTRVPEPYGEEDARQWQRTASTGLRTGSDLPTLITDADRWPPARRGRPAQPRPGERALLGRLLGRRGRAPPRSRAPGAHCCSAGYAFADLGVQRVELWIEPENAAVPARRRGRRASPARACCGPSCTSADGGATCSCTRSCRSTSS